MAHAGRGRRDQHIGEFLGHFGAEKTGMGVSQPVNLGMHGRQHLGVAVAKAGHGSAAAGIQVSFAARIKQGDAPARHRQRQFVLQLAVEHMGARRTDNG